MILFVHNHFPGINLNRNTLFLEKTFEVCFPFLRKCSILCLSEAPKDKMCISLEFANNFEVPKNFVKTKGNKLNPYICLKCMHLSIDF